MAETLDAGLALLFGGDGGRSAVPTTATPEAETPSAAGTGVTATLIRQVQESYDRAIAAQRAGNWAQYGEEIKRLGEVLEKMSRARR